MLLKLFGGVLTIAGATIAVVMATRNPVPEGLNMMLAIIPGLGGTVLFLISSRLLNKHSFNETNDRTRLSIVSWGLLLVFSALFLAWVRFITR